MSAPVTRHPVYYFPDGTHVFLVENTLYKLHDSILIAHSALFKDMFTIGNASACFSTEGKSDLEPIFLEGERQAIFDLFLDHINGRAHSVSSDDAYSHEQLWDLLQFVDKYRCPRTRRFVINHIWDVRYSYHPAELIQIGCRFHILKLFKRGFKLLLDIPLTQITKPIRLQMGNDVFIALVYAKSALEEHTRIIANGEPVILAHATDCQDSVACEEDWHTVWWNGMGRFLLDGRNPQPFPDAVKRFREMQFSRMGAGCQKLMFHALERGVGFRYVDIFVSNICDELMNELRIADM